MKRSQRVLLPPSFAALLPADDRARLRRMQAGLEAHLHAADDGSDGPEVDPAQAVADLAQWYLKIAAEPLAADVTVDVEQCALRLSDAAELGVRPSREGVERRQRAWLSTSRWPCFPGDEHPPLLRGG